MFTVIIAEKNIIDIYTELEVFLSPLASKNIAFCEWNKNGDSLQDMLPGLYDVVAYQREWKAIIINQDKSDKKNPFDYVEYREENNKSKNQWEKIKIRRNTRFDCYDRAINNPLTRLTSALCGVQTLSSVISEDEDFDRIISGQMELYEYMLYRCLAREDISYFVAHLKKFQRDKVNRFAPEDKVDLLLKYIEEKDIQGVVNIVGKENIIDLIDMLSDNDPFYSDPEYVESIIDNTKKKKIFDNITKLYSLDVKLPDEVICVAPRTLEKYSFVSTIEQIKFDESNYSRFAEFNLYPEKLKYIVFDMLSETQKQYKAELIRLLCFLLIMAGNTRPSGRIRENRVYRAEVDFDSLAIGRACSKYIGKLKATLSKIAVLQHDLQLDMKATIDDQTSRELFESPIDIPVQIKEELKKKDLYAQYKEIGLSGNCPRSEAVYWDSQYHTIRKLFVRYLREPRRAVKTAVKEYFQKENTIENETALLLNEYQKEDIEYKLLEEEQNMVETITPHLFNTVKYNKMIEEADKELRRGIGQRMTKKKTVSAGLIVLLAYLFGCMPLLFGNFSFSSSKPFLIALAITGSGLLVLFIAGMIYLFVLRRRLIDRFKHFNYVISGICNEIENGLKAFSKYLGHACNVMREFSVLEYTRENQNRKENILKKHQLDVEGKIKEISEAFSEYVVLSKIHMDADDAYDYDFHLMKNYAYEMPCSETRVDIEFLQPGNYISVPVDYIERVMLIREELYD